jgi:hypothetical protein
MVTWVTDMPLVKPEDSDDNQHSRLNLALYWAS